MKHFLSFAIATFCWGVFVGSPALTQAQDATSRSEIKPADVFVQVKLVQEELELIRFVMGRPANLQLDLEVSGAAPREVYFQALTMFRKADRLCFEHTRRHSEEPKLPDSEIMAADVFQVVKQVLECIEQVKQKLGIEQEATPPSRDDSKTPNDVFRAAVQANRQLNLLLEQRFSPSDVFAQVTNGVGYTSRLLESFPDATTIPDEPPLEVGKRPSDVYRRLVSSFERIRTIADSSGIEMLQLHVGDEIATAEPSDVYDIASLLVSELAFLHSQLPDAQPPRKAYYAGRKFPSHVFQRAGLLEQQLIELDRHVQAEPDWLTNSRDRP